MNDTATLWDLYREIHEAVRDALFGATTLAGQTDAAGADAVRRLLDAWRRVGFAVDPHQAHAQPSRELPTRRREQAPPRQLEAARRCTNAAIEQLHRFAKGLAQPLPTRPAHMCARSMPAWTASRRSAWRTHATRKTARLPVLSVAMSATNWRR